MKWQNLGELDAWRSPMRRCALVGLLASVLVLLGTAEAPSTTRHKHRSPHPKKAIEAQQLKHAIGKSAIESARPLAADLSAAKQAIELIRRHKTKEATALAAGSSDPVIAKLVEWAHCCAHSGPKPISLAMLVSSAPIPIGQVCRSYVGARR